MKFPDYNTVNVKICRKSYYRAEIKENGRVVDALKGRWNTYDELWDWIDEYWGKPIIYKQELESWQSVLTLTVWRYSCIATPQIIIKARLGGGAYGR